MLGPLMSPLRETPLTSTLPSFTIGSDREMAENQSWGWRGGENTEACSREQKERGMKAYMEMILHGCHHLP